MSTFRHCTLQASLSLQVSLKPYEVESRALRKERPDSVPAWGRPGHCIRLFIGEYESVTIHKAPCKVQTLNKRGTFDAEPKLGPRPLIGSCSGRANGSLRSCSIKVRHDRHYGPKFGCREHVRERKPSFSHSHWAAVWLHRRRTVHSPKDLGRQTDGVSPTHW